MDPLVSNDFRHHEEPPGRAIGAPEDKLRDDMIQGRLLSEPDTGLPRGRSAARNDR